jgi:hypothetical protein
MRDQYGIDAAFLDLIAHQMGEGWEEIRPEEVGALTSSIIPTDNAVRDDLGVLTRCGSSAPEGGAIEPRPRPCRWRRGPGRFGKATSKEAGSQKDSLHERLWLIQRYCAQAS